MTNTMSMCENSEEMSWMRHACLVDSGLYTTHRISTKYAATSYTIEPVNQMAMASEPNDATVMAAAALFTLK